MGRRAVHYSLTLVASRWETCARDNEPLPEACNMHCNEQNVEIQKGCGREMGNNYRNCIGVA